MAHEFVIECALAANEDHVVDFVSVPDLRCPGGAALGMARRQVGDHYLIAELDGFSVVDNLIGGDQWKGERVAEAKITVPAATKEWGVALAGQEFRSCDFLELSQSAGVIEMRMAVQQKFYIGQFESELGDVALDLRRGFDKAAVEQEIAFWRGDQV